MPNERPPISGAICDYAPTGRGPMQAYREPPMPSLASLPREVWLIDELKGNAI